MLFSDILVKICDIPLKYWRIIIIALSIVSMPYATYCNSVVTCRCPIFSTSILVRYSISRPGADTTSLSPRGTLHPPSYKILRGSRNGESCLCAVTRGHHLSPLGGREGYTSTNGIRKRRLEQIQFQPVVMLWGQRSGLSVCLRDHPAWSSSPRTSARIYPDPVGLRRWPCEVWLRW